MDRKIAETIAEFGEFELMEDYSGRFMYGSTTYGIIVPGMSEFAHACIEAALQEPEIMQDALSELFRTDNMGLDVIIY